MGNQHYYSYYGSDPEPSAPNGQPGQSPHVPTQQPQGPSDNPSQDFERLCRVIGDSVSQATRAIGESLQNSKEPLKEGLTNAGNAVSEAIGKSMESYKRRQAEAEARAELQRQQAIIEARFAPSGKAKGAAIAQTVFGGIFSLSFVDAFLNQILLSGTLSMGSWLASVAITGVLSFFSVKMLVNGTNKIRLADVIKKYKAVIGQREVVSIDELATRTGSTPRKTLATVEELIDKGLLPQGRLDDERTTLILTNEAYSAYLQYRKEQAQREHEALMRKQRAEAEAKALGLTPEMRAFFQSGQDYLRQMRQLDDAIQDEAVSAKVVAIEGVVQRILARAKEEPSLIDGLGRLMNYYLPTTVKLLTAYDALEEQTVQGENITASRQEIEQTLDVLYAAYEKLLDATFENLSMDVSSDITVLHTVLAQEGLVDGPFDKPIKDDPQS